MCGIAGILQADRGDVEAATRRMMRAMAHRGPDDEGYAQFPLGGDPAGPAVGFGFRRLAIMDLSPLGHQPMIDRRTGDAIIFNGEIYNFRELRARLRSAGHGFESTGDTEVLLAALSAWGEHAIDELDGMFALAFFQAATHRVLLARDPLGIKPLYVARRPGAVVFASEIRAILASGMVPGDLDPAGLATFLAYGAPQDPLTVHRHIRSMASGTHEWIDLRAVTTGDTHPRRYWRFPEPCRSRADEAATVAQVRSLLEKSVQRQCLADVSVGVFLSGGIDSAAMAAFATVHGNKADTFAVGYELDGVADETEAAAETAAFLGTRHFQTIVDDAWVMLQWYEWLKAADRPSIDGLNTYIVSGAVRDRDITVALSGLGADELFGGYPSFQRVPKLVRAMRLVSWLPRAVRRQAAAATLAWLPAGKRAKLTDLLASSGSAIDLTALTRRTLGDGMLQALGFDFRTLGLSPAFLPPEAYGLMSETGDTFATVSEAEAALYMGSTLLRDVDVNSMAHSLEVRVPFLGRQLVDHVAALPGAIRAPRNAPAKHLLRLAIADRLPETVFSRPKKGFSLPFGDWIFGPLREQAEAAISALAGCGIVDSAAVQAAWRTYAERRNEIHWSRPMSLVVLGSYVGKMADSLRA